MLRRPRRLLLLALPALLITNSLLLLRLFRLHVQSELPAEWRTEANLSRATPLRSSGTPARDSAAELEAAVGLWDRQRRYLRQPAAVPATQHVLLSEQLELTLATQASLDRLLHVLELAQRWRGPLSVAVFCPDVEAALVRRYAAFLRRCSQHVRRQVTFSWLIPAERPARPAPAAAPPQTSLSCDEPRQALGALLQARPKTMLRWRETMAYPQNALRNLARKTSSTRHVLLVDVDVVPSPDAAGRLAAFLRSSTARDCGRCVFVLPAYEVEAGRPFPESATQLLQLVRDKRARPFHTKVFLHNQFATNHSWWEQHVLMSSETRISHPVTEFEFFYEPFYVSRDDVPEHDERFIGYGFTRNTQCYETLSAGYKFHVLAPVFAVHWGLQTRKNRPAWREVQNNQNRRRFTAFKREVYSRYGTDPLGMMKNSPVPNKSGGHRSRRVGH